MSEKKASVTLTRQEGTAGQLVTQEQICADKNGKIVPCDSPEANTLVAAPGVPIPPKMAKLYGLKAAGDKEEEPEPEPKAEEHHVLGEGGEARPSRTVRSLK